MTTLTRKIADFEAEFQELSAAAASPRTRRRQMGTPSPSSTKSLEAGAEDPNNNHKTAAVEFHCSDGDLAKVHHQVVEETEEAVPQVISSKTTFNVLNVSTMLFFELLFVFLFYKRVFSCFKF